MPNNLDEKIALLWNDIKYMSDEDVRKAIKNLVLNEVNFINGEHIIEESELGIIQSRAAKEWVDTDLKNLGIDKSYEKTWFLAESVVGLLKSKGLIPFKLILRKKR